MKKANGSADASTPIITIGIRDIASAWSRIIVISRRRSSLSLFLSHPPARSLALPRAGAVR